MSLKPRQRSEISLSLASVLVIERERPQIVLESFCQRFGRRLALLAVDVLQQIERRLDGKRLAADLEAQGCDRLVEQPVPGRITGHRLLVEELLDPVFELVGLFLAHVLDPGPIMAERGIAHRSLQQRVIDAIELKREKQEMQRGRREAFLHVTVEFRSRGIGGVAGIHQRCVGHQPAKPVVDGFIARDRFRKRRPPRPRQALRAGL